MRRRDDLLARVKAGDKKRNPIDHKRWFDQRFLDFCSNSCSNF